MRRLLSKIENRKLYMIELLYQKNDYMPIEDLAAELQTSVRNLKEDIAEMDNLSDILTITLLQDKVKMEFHQNTGVESVTQYLINHNFSYKLLEEMFFNETLHLEELAESMYVSTSTIYRQFRKIEDVLKENFTVELKTNPCRVSGNEEDIRAFYVTFFSEKYSIFDWPFEDIVSEKLMDDLVESLIDLIGIDVDFSFLRYVKYVGIIGLLRYKNNYFLNEDVETGKYEIIDEAARTFDLTALEDALDIKITEETLSETFAVFLQANVPFTNEDFIRKANQSPVITHSYFRLLEMINALSKKYELPIPNRDDMIIGVHNTLFLGRSELYTNFILNDKKRKFVQAAEELYPDFYEDLYHYMTDYVVDIYERNDKILLNHMVYTFMTHWDDLFVSLKAQQKKASVLLVSSNDIKHAMMMRPVIDFEFSEQLEITIGTDLKVIKEALSSNSYDLIISNFPIEDNPHSRVICVENVPTRANMLTIMENLMSVSDE